MYQIILCIPDHLLSYFLGANDGASHDSNIPAVDIAVEKQRHQQPAAPQSILRSSSQPNSIHANNKMVGNLPNTSPSLESFVNARARDSSGALTNNTGTSMSMGTLPTPHSVHFYDEQYPPQAAPSAAAAMPSHVDPSLQYRTNSQGSMPKIPSRASNASSNGSSSSSLAAMASAMALGNPTQVMMMQQKLQNRADQVVSGVQYQLNSNISPITPVNMMMGSPSGQEFMMLPPPTQSNNMIAQMAQNIGGQQQHPHQQHLMNLQQNMLMAQAPISMNNQVPNNAFQQQQQQQQTNFLPQMNPPNQQPPLATMQTQTYAKGGFPDPQSVTSSVLAAQPPTQQQQYPELPQQPMSQPHLPQQPQQSQQIQIGVNGQTIPINAVPTANGGLVYQIDSSVVPTAGLRYFTKAINDVSKPEEKKNVDPQVMAEKRAQRLARNRQSARNSRRRKKEHLQNLEAKVQKLQCELESEVRSKVSSMEEGLMKQREDMMEQWLVKQPSDSASPDEEQGGDDERRKQLALILQETGVNCQIRRAVVAHQYNMLRNTFLSPMNHYSVWMLLQSASFFTEAARQRDADAAASGEIVNKVNDRANSKAIGETIYNEDKERVGRVISNSNDGLKTWPLYCHEITMTMEQEERIVNQLHVK